jgi:ADP-ribose pyrophosphatase YjhB (NUDIX family)
MPVLHHKVFAYITHRNRLLVFSHTDFPEAGIQVPAGTLNDGEDPEVGVLREAWEETGLSGLQLLGLLGECDFPAPDLDQLHRRRFYHLICEGDPPATWQHWESHPSDGTTEPISFDFFWVGLPNGVPPLAPGHDAMLSELLVALER